jgi:hypothetical protein
MTDTEQKKLNGFLSKTLKMEAEDMASLYNEAGELVSLTAAEKADTARVAKLKDDNDSQYKRGQKEVASKLEAKLKDKYEIESELTGVELIDHILSEEVKKVKGNGEDISAHPEYVKLKLENDKALKAKDKEWQKKIDEVEVTHSKQLIFSKIKDRAFAELDNLKPILPEDSRKAQKWREKFIEEFKNFEYQEQDGKFIIIKDGKPLQDSHGYTKSFEDHVKETASDFFEFQTAEARSSAGNKQAEGTNGKVVVKDKDDYTEKTRLAKTPQERIELLNAYEQLTKTK